ncbi:putative urocanate hydratase [Penaeus vannamei]|uniref:Putative urocanate hydratase n=1 Tax=Penaeus vannamei TaxID=6689 RepID=A0A3R7MFX0_PENVA|nr:putative urocanate hydratase [Penaeus vannamei]
MTTGSNSPLTTTRPYLSVTTTRSRISLTTSASFSFSLTTTSSRIASPQHLSLPYLSPIQLTVLNAGRKYLHLDSLSGKVFLTSGLGGMSGAQAKAAVICGCIGVVAEVSEEALKKRHEQGWLLEYTDNLDNLIRRIREARRKKEVTSIGFHGNVVSVWERLVQEYEQTGELLVELGSDQTSCHNPFSGGYYPVQLSFKEAQEVRTWFLTKASEGEWRVSKNQKGRSVKGHLGSLAELVVEARGKIYVLRERLLEGKEGSNSLIKLCTHGDTQGLREDASCSGGRKEEVDGKWTRRKRNRERRDWEKVGKIE